MTSIVPEVRNSNVRKWRNLILGVTDWRDPLITLPKTLGDLFHMDPADPAVTANPALLYTPKALPSGVKDMGYLTVDGITDTKDLKSDGVQMLQSLEDVRTDITGLEKTLTGNFGEQNAWTNGMRAGEPVANWPANKNSGFVFADGQIADFPYYTFWLLGQDGVGPSAVFRFELFPKVKNTGMEGRKRNAADPETLGNTWGLFRDDTIGKSHIIAQEGPGLTEHETATKALY